MRRGPFLDENEAFKYNYLASPKGKIALAAFGRLFDIRETKYSELKDWLKSGEKAVSDIYNSGLNDSDKILLYRLVSTYMNRYGGSPLEKNRDDILRISRDNLELRNQMKYDEIPSMDLIERKKKRKTTKVKRKCRCKNG
jgi:hypothetical protein